MNIFLPRTGLFSWPPRGLRQECVFPRLFWSAAVGQNCMTTSAHGCQISLIVVEVVSVDVVRYDVQVRCAYSANPFLLGECFLLRFHFVKPKQIDFGSFSNLFSVRVVLSKTILLFRIVRKGLIPVLRSVRLPKTVSGMPSTVGVLCILCKVGLLLGWLFLVSWSRM